MDRSPQCLEECYHSYIQDNCLERFSSLHCSDTPRSRDVITGFLQEPFTGRGTTGIIWGSIAVVVLCTWSVIHLDIRALSPASGVSLKIKARSGSKATNTSLDRDVLAPRSSQLVTTKILGVLTLILLPKHGIFMAVEEFFLGMRMRQSTRMVPGWEKFSLKQAHLVRMGGLHLPNLERPEDFHHFATQSSPFLDYERFPSNSAISIRARSDFLVKTMAIVQSFFFVVNIAMRISTSYRIASLEVFTTVHIVYCIILFLAHIKKPRDVGEMFDLNLSRMLSQTLLPDEPEPDNVNQGKSRNEPSSTWLYSLSAAGVWHTSYQQAATNSIRRTSSSSSLSLRWEQHELYALETAEESPVELRDTCQAWLILFCFHTGMLDGRRLRRCSLLPHLLGISRIQCRAIGDLCRAAILGALFTAC